MATILDVIKEVAPVIGIDVPTVVMTSTIREHVELKALANEMAARIAKAHDWQALKVIATYTGNGVIEDFDLPSDYDRMLKKAKVWSSTITQPLSHVADSDDWLGLDVQGVDLVFGAWTIYANQIHIKTALASAATAKHWYMSNLVVRPNAGSDKAAFTADDDTFRLSARLLNLGMIWQWKANKGLAYGEDMANYEELKEKLISDDKGSRRIVLGEQRTPRGVDQAYPFPVTP